MSGNPTPRSEPVPGGVTVDSNFWSGIVTHHDGVGAVAGTFTVPTADGGCGASADLAEWVGLGGTTYGQPSGTSLFPFVQAGFSVSADGHARSWYELFDHSGNGPIVAGQALFKAGDHVTVSTTFSADHTELTFTWIDLTTDAATTATVPDASAYYPTSGSAEWISERYPRDGIMADLPPLLDITTPIAVTDARIGQAGEAGASTEGLRGNTTLVTMAADRPMMLTKQTSNTAFTNTFAGCT